MDTKEVRKKGDSATSLLIKRIMLGSAVTAVVFFVLLCIASFAVMKSNTDESVYLVTGRIAAVISGLTGGFVSVLPVRRKGLVTGASCGALGAVPAVIAVIIANPQSSPVAVMILFVLFSLSAAGGGIAAANISKKQKIK